MDQKEAIITSWCRLVKTLNSCFVRSVGQRTNKQLSKCMFPEWSLDRSGLCCADTYFHDLRGRPTSSVTFLLVSVWVDALPYCSGCLQTATISDHHFLHCCADISDIKVETSVRMSTPVGFRDTVSNEIHHEFNISNSSQFAPYFLCCVKHVPLKE